MKKLTLLLLLLLLVIPVGTAAAAPLSDGDQKVGTGETVNNDIIIVDGDLDVEEDATVNGDVILFNGDLTVEIGATINGDVVLMNGDAEIDGKITGDIVLFNGELDAGETAVVTGDCALLNGDLDDTTTAGINCTDVANMPTLSMPSMPSTPSMPSMPSAPSMPDMPSMPSAPDMPSVHVSSGPSFFAQLSWAAMQSLVLAAIAFGIATLFPTQLRRIEDTAREKTIASGMVGLLTAVSTTLIILFLIPVSIILTFVCIGLLGFPIMFIMGMMLTLAAFAGWVGIGSWVGTTMARLLKLKNRNLPVTAALGMATLVFGLGIIDAVPFFFGETIIVFLLVMVGLGAVVSTRFGTQGTAVSSIPPSPKMPAEKPAPPQTDDVMEEDAEKVTAVMETLYIDADDV